MNHKWILWILFFFAWGILENFESFMFPRKYAEAVIPYASEFRLEPALVWAVMKAESDFQAEAVSKKKATGLMQLMYETAQSGAKALKIQNFEEKMLFDPHTNIRIGCWYLNRLYAEFESTYAVLAAYNAGGRNVNQWFSEIAYADLSQEAFINQIKFGETRFFVARVMNNYNKYKQIYEGKGGGPHDGTL